MISIQNEKSRKDFLLTKIAEAKNMTVVTDSRVEIIEAARQRQKANKKTKQLKLVSASPEPDTLSDVNSKFEFTSSSFSTVFSDIERNVDNDLLLHDSSMKIKNRKELKENQHFTAKSSDLQSQNISAIPLIMTSCKSKKNISPQCDIEFPEKSKSMVSSYSPSKLFAPSPTDASQHAATLSSTVCSTHPSGTIIFIAL